MFKLLLGMPAAFAVASPCFAETSCLQLLTSPSLVASRPNDIQRNQALVLELKRLSPEPLDNRIDLNGRDQLRRLSHANRDGLIQRLYEIHPASPQLNEAAERQIANIADRMRFHYLHDQEETPLLSVREQKRTGAAVKADFYSELVNDSPSVDFRMVATLEDLPNVSRDSFRLNDEFALSFGFVLPQPAEARDLVRLFSAWDPEALQNWINGIRYSLPNSVRTGADLLSYPPLVSLSPREFWSLGTHLNQFVLSTADAEDFYREAFRHYLRINGVQSVVPGSNIFTRGFMEFLSMPAPSLRIPLRVDAFTILRPETSRRELLAPTPPRPRTSPWPVQRLDHAAMP